jgi:hypothetical protein
VFLDNETNQPIGAIDACVTAQYLRESTWETEHPINKPLFMQFHHRDDAGVNITCMEKAQELLVEHGYADRGTFLLGDGTNPSLEAHFWQPEYTQPILDFFDIYCVRVQRK